MLNLHKGVRGMVIDLAAIGAICSIVSLIISIFTLGLVMKINVNMRDNIAQTATGRDNKQAGRDIGA